MVWMKSAWFLYGGCQYLSFFLLHSWPGCCVWRVRGYAFADTTCSGVPTTKGMTVRSSLLQFVQEISAGGGVCTVWGGESEADIGVGITIGLAEKA